MDCCPRGEASPRNSIKAMDCCPRIEASPRNSIKAVDCCPRGEASPRNSIKTLDFGPRGEASSRGSIKAPDTGDIFRSQSDNRRYTETADLDDRPRSAQVLHIYDPESGYEVSVRRTPSCRSRSQVQPNAGDDQQSAYMSYDERAPSPVQSQRPSVARSECPAPYENSRPASSLDNLADVIAQEVLAMINDPSVYDESWPDYRRYLTLGEIIAKHICKYVIEGGRETKPGTPLPSKLQDWLDAKKQIQERMIAECVVKQVMMTLKSVIDEGVEDPSASPALTPKKASSPQPDIGGLVAAEAEKTWNPKYYRYSVNRHMDTTESAGTDTQAAVRGDNDNDYYLKAKPKRDSKCKKKRSIFRESSDSAFMADKSSSDSCGQIDQLGDKVVYPTSQSPSRGTLTPKQQAVVDTMQECMKDLLEVCQPENEDGGLSPDMSAFAMGMIPFLPAALAPGETDNQQTEPGAERFRTPPEKTTSFIQTVVEKVLEEWLRRGYSVYDRRPRYESLAQDIVARVYDCWHGDEQNPSQNDQKHDASVMQLIANEVLESISKKKASLKPETTNEALTEEHTQTLTVTRSSVRCLVNYVVDQLFSLDESRRKSATDQITVPKGNKKRGSAAHSRSSTARLSETISELVMEKLTPKSSKESIVEVPPIESASSRKNLNVHGDKRRKKPRSPLYTQAKPTSKKVRPTTAVDTGTRLKGQGEESLVDLVTAVVETLLDESYTVNSRNDATPEDPRYRGQSYAGETLPLIHGQVSLLLPSHVNQRLTIYKSSRDQVGGIVDKVLDRLYNIPRHESVQKILEQHSVDSLVDAIVSVLRSEQTEGANYIPEGELYDAPKVKHRARFQDTSRNPSISIAEQDPQSNVFGSMSNTCQQYDITYNAGTVRPKSAPYPKPQACSGSPLTPRNTCVNFDPESQAGITRMQSYINESLNKIRCPDCPRHSVGQQLCRCPEKMNMGAQVQVVRKSPPVCRTPSPSIDEGSRISSKSMLPSKSMPPCVLGDQLAQAQVQRARAKSTPGTFLASSSSRRVSSPNPPVSMYIHTGSAPTFASPENRRGNDLLDPSMCEQDKLLLQGHSESSVQRVLENCVGDANLSQQGFLSPAVPPNPANSMASQYVNLNHGVWSQNPVAACQQKSDHHQPGICDHALHIFSVKDGEDVNNLHAAVRRISYFDVDTPDTTVAMKKLNAGKAASQWHPNEEVQEQIDSGEEDGEVVQEIHNLDSQRPPKQVNNNYNHNRDRVVDAAKEGAQKVVKKKTPEITTTRNVLPSTDLNVSRSNSSGIPKSTSSKRDYTNKTKALSTNVYTPPKSSKGKVAAPLKAKSKKKFCAELSGERENSKRTSPSVASKPSNTFIEEKEYEGSTVEVLNSCHSQLDSLNNKDRGVTSGISSRDSSQGDVVRNGLEDTIAAKTTEADNPIESPRSSDEVLRLESCTDLTDLTPLTDNNSAEEEKESPKTAQSARSKVETPESVESSESESQLYTTTDLREESEKQTSKAKSRELMSDLSSDTNTPSTYDSDYELSPKECENVEAEGTCIAVEQGQVASNCGDSVTAVESLVPIIIEPPSPPEEEEDELSGSPEEIQQLLDLTPRVRSN